MMIRAIVCCILMGLVGINGCRNPLEGVTIGLKDPIQDGVVECHFYDPAGNPLPKNNQIKMAGPNAEQVVTTVNTIHYKINADGMLLVAASPSALISAQKPFRFSVVAEAPDYLTVIQPIVLTDVSRQTRNLRWINLLKPPPTLAAARSGGQATEDGLVTSAFRTTTTQLSSDADQATATVPANTRLVGRDGLAVGGELTLTMIHTNARNDASASYIPGNGVMWSVFGRNGGPSQGNIRVLSLAGSVTIQLYNEKYDLVTTASQPVSWAMDLNPNAYNLTARRTIRENDSIPLYSYDEFTSRWQEEAPGIVKRNAQTNRLEYRANARTMGTYVVGWSESICDVGPVFAVKSGLSDVDVNYLCKLIDVDNGQQVASFYANVNNGQYIQIYNQSKNRRLKVQVYDETDAWGKGAKGGLIGESAPGLTCDRTPIPINLTPLPVPTKVTVEFSFACAGGMVLDEASLPALVKVQYSETGRDSWRDLITLTRTQRKALSYKLLLSHRYDLRASSDGGATWPLRQDNYLIETPKITLTIHADQYCK